MIVTKGFVLALALASAGVMLNAAAPPAGALPSIRLKTISSRVDAKGTALVVEASEPVPYVMTRPDPLTVLLDFRNVSAEGVANRVTASAKSPIARVDVEPADSLGIVTSRIRISLAEPVTHHVRSDRNRVVVEFDASSTAGRPYVLPPASGIELTEVRATDPIAALNLQTLVSPSPTVAAQALTAAAAAQAPPQPPAPVQEPLGRPVPGQQRYTGTPVSFDYQDADLRAVLRVFHDITGLNIVIDPLVQGTVNVALTDVPWDQALDIILRANKLGYIVDGTIVRIAPLAALADEESQRRKLSEEQALSGELRVLTRTLSYAKAQDLVALLTRSMLSARGNVQVDPRTNMLIITDLQDRLTTAEEIIASLDKPQPQVEIEARIVQTTRQYARALGVQWGFNGRLDPALGNTTNLAFPNSGVLSGGVDLAAPGTNSAVNLALGSVNGAFNLDLALSAAESTGNLRLLSTPRVSTQNNVAAEIVQGVQIVYFAPASLTSPSVPIFRDATLSLRVTPQITAAGTVIMNIAVVNDSPGPNFNGVTSIDTQRATTTVLVSDGQTTVIGGIYRSQQGNTTGRTPGIGQVPFLSWLFKRETIDDDSRELLIFITPRIIRL